MNSSYHHNPALPPGKSLRSKIWNYFSVRINGESNPSSSRPAPHQPRQPQTQASHHNRQRRSDHSHARAGHNATKEQVAFKKKAGGPWDMPQAAPLPNKPAAAKLRFWDGVVADFNAAIGGPPPPRHSRSGVQRPSGGSSTPHHHRHRSERSNADHSSSRRQHPERADPLHHHQGHHERSDSGYRSVASQDRRRGHDEHQKHAPAAEPRPASYRAPFVETIPEAPTPVSFKQPKEGGRTVKHSPAANAGAELRAHANMPADADLGVRHPSREPTGVLRMPFTEKTEPLYSVRKHNVQISERSAAARNSVRASITTQGTRWGDFITPPSDLPVPKLPSSSAAKSVAPTAPHRSPSSKKTPSSTPSTSHRQQTSHPANSAPNSRKAVPKPSHISPPIARNSLMPSPLVTRKTVPPPPRMPKANEPRDPSRCELCKGPSNTCTSWADIDRHLCLTCAQMAFYPEPAPHAERKASPAPTPVEFEPDSDSDDFEPQRVSPTSTVFAPLFPKLSRPPVFSSEVPSQYLPPSASGYAPPSPSSLDPNYALPSPTSPVAPHAFGAGSYTDRYASTMDLNPFASAYPWLRPATGSSEQSSGLQGEMVREELEVGPESSSSSEAAAGVKRSKAVKRGNATRDLIKDHRPLAPPRSPSPLIPVPPIPMGVETGAKSPAARNRRSSFYKFYDDVLRPGSEWAG